MLSDGFIRLSHTIVAGHRPCCDLLVGVLGVEVGLLPNTEEDFLGEHVGSGESLSRIEDGDGGSGLDSSYREGRLQAVLVNVIGADDIVVSLVELLLVRPCSASAIPSTESEAAHLETLLGMHNHPGRQRRTYTTFGMSALYSTQTTRTD